MRAEGAAAALVSGGVVARERDLEAAALWRVVGHGPAAVWWWRGVASVRVWVAGAVSIRVWVTGAAALRRMRTGICDRRVIERIAAVLVRVGEGLCSCRSCRQEVVEEAVVAYSAMPSREGMLSGGPVGGNDGAGAGWTVGRFGWAVWQRGGSWVENTV